jgi:hypothetical protein
MKPRILAAQGTPRLWNIALVKSGKQPAKTERKKVFAAIALAEAFWYVSIR